MKKGLKTILIYLIATIIIVLSGAIIIIKNDLKVIEVTGHSMYPTLTEKNYVLSTNYDELKNGDIILFKHEKTRMIKRVIGIPGDTISITEDGQVYVNNELLKEDYINKHQGQFQNEIKYPITIPEGEYFVLGDNRLDSLDSRIISVGNIKEEEIIGKIAFVLYPPKSLK